MRHSTPARVIDRAALTAAFKDLRSQGYLARMNFTCCRSCAGVELAERAVEMADRNVAVKGCVFYTHQDADDLRAHEQDLYLAYGPLETQQRGTIGDATEVIGQALMATLQRHGLTVEWDGNPLTRILVVGVVVQ